MAADASPERPKVSVLLQTYNHERFIGPAIESVVHQDAPFPIEVIVSDDYSSDGTRVLVSKHARAHPELIKPLFPDRHLGMNPLFRRALNTARGDYLALLDGDDFWTSERKLRRQVALLESEPDLTGCFHDARVLSEDGTRPESRYVPGPKKARFDFEDLLRLCYPPTLSVVFRRQMLPFVPGWVFDMAWADWLVWIFATRHGPFGYIDEALGVYRVHRGGFFSSKDRSSQLEEDLCLYRRLVDEFPEHHGLLERCIARRDCELAVEECGLPYDAPVVVVDEPDDPPPSFNGRTTRYLEPAKGGDAGDTCEAPSAATRLEHFCREEIAPATPFWRPRVPPRESRGRNCYVVVPNTSRARLTADHDLAAKLERDASMLRNDSRCAVYELPRVVAEVVELSRADAPDGRVRGRVGQPSAGSLVDPSAVKIVGWALGNEAPVATVEVESGGRIVWRGPVGVDRPDLAEAFPDRAWAGKAGFVGEVDVQDALGDDEALELDVTAVLGNGERTRIATVRLARAATSPAQAGR
jgi:glycosyltransferase involved in cell wall biosynthesis